MKESAIVVQGVIVGITSKEIKPGRNGKKFDPFTVHTYFIVGDGGGRPVEVRSTNNGRETGDEVEIPVYIRPWRTERNSGFEIREAMQN